MIPNNKLVFICTGIKFYAKVYKKFKKFKKYFWLSMGFF